MSRSLDVIVGGAGLGGLALGRGLLDMGHRVRIVELSAQRNGGGAAVTIFPNGAAALDRLGIGIDGLGARIERMVFSRHNGDRLMAFDLGDMKRRFGHAVRTVPRRGLVEHLEKGLPQGLVRFGCAIDAVRTGDHVTVELASGVQMTADVVVGADGHHSIVRRCTLDPTPAAYAGWATWQGLTTILPDLAAGATGYYYVGDAGFVGLMPAGSDLLQWWFDVPWSTTDDPPTSPTTWLRDRFSSYGGAVPALLNSISDADIGFFPHVFHQILDQWGTGPSTLLGDAAHAFPPSQAQGANQAFEDAWMLTRALSTADDVDASLRRYEAIRAKRLRLVSKMAVSERTNRPPSPFLRMVARLVPDSVACRSYTRLLRRFSSVLSEDEL